MAPPLAFFHGPLPWVALAAVTVVFLALDLHFFARGREPTFREGVVWSIGWLVVSLLAAVVVLVLSNRDDAITYTTVYFIERSLSLDNLFVFLLLFSYFGGPRGASRAAAVLGHRRRAGAARAGDPRRRRADRAVPPVIYALGVMLLVLAWRILRGVEENVDPDRNAMVRPASGASPVTASSTASAGSSRATGAAGRRRCSCAWRRSSPPTSRSRSTRSPPRSRSRPTRC